MLEVLILKMIPNHYKCKLEVCVPELVLNETRQDETGGQFPNWPDQDKTSFSGPFAQENLGKIWEINMTGLDYSVPPGKVLSSTEFQDFSRKTSITNGSSLNQMAVQ